MTLQTPPTRVVKQERLAVLGERCRANFVNIADSIWSLAEWGTEAKSLCSHGEWLAWANEYDLPVRKLQSYMRVRRVLGHRIREVADLGVATLILLAQSTTPDTAVEEVLQRWPLVHEEVRAIVAAHRGIQAMRHSLKTILAFRTREDIDTAYLQSMLTLCADAEMTGAMEDDAGAMTLLGELVSQLAKGLRQREHKERNAIDREWLVSELPVVIVEVNERRLVLERQRDGAWDFEPGELLDVTLSRRLP